MYRECRRFFVAIWSVLWIFTACNAFLPSMGCAPDKRTEELFFYRSEKVEARIRMECNGVTSCFRYVGDESGCRIEFTAPEELCGYALETDGVVGRVAFDGLTAEAPQALCTVPNIMRTVFTLSPESVTAIETASEPQNAEERVTAVTAGGITVTLDKSGLPIRAEGALFGVSFRAEIADFYVAKSE